MIIINIQMHVKIFIKKKYPKLILITFRKVTLFRFVNFIIVFRITRRIKNNKKVGIPFDTHNTNFIHNTS